MMGSGDRQTQHAAVVEERLGPATLARRLSMAMQHAALLAKVARRGSKVSEREGVRRLQPEVSWSTYRGWKRRFTANGCDGLVDARVPWVGKVTASIRDELVSARKKDPTISVEILRQQVVASGGPRLSESTVKRVLRQGGVNRVGGGVRGPRRKDKGPVSGSGADVGDGGRGDVVLGWFEGARELEPPIRLELAGMKLLEIGARETGLLKAVADGIVAEVSTLEVGVKDLGPDVAGRDDNGRFLGAYNERYRKQGAALGPGFASVSSKRETKDPARFKIAQVSDKVIERKVWALMSLPMFTANGMEVLRAPSGAWMEEVCGYPYMPATLDKMLRELKYAGIAEALWDRAATVMLERQKEWMGPTPVVMATYIDSTSKPLWTGLFTKAGKVASNGRVMPCLQAVMVHTGVGVPVYVETFSGRAGLQEHCERILSKLEKLVGAVISRIVVMDAEVNSAKLLKRLEDNQRPWVTMLKGNLLKNKEVIDRHGNWAYRDGDTLSEGSMDLPLGPRKEDGFYRVRVVELTHRGTGKVSTIGTCLNTADYDAKQVVDYYYARWPSQEGNIRALKQGMGFEHIHGYGKELVENVGVITELEKASHRLSTTTTTLEQAKKARQAMEPRLLEATRQEGLTRARAKALDERIGRLRKDHGAGPRYVKMLEQRIDLDVEIRRREKEVAACKHTAGGLDEKVEKAREKITELQGRTTDLGGQRFIYRNDTELDSLGSLMKVSFAFVIEWVMRVVLGGASMEYRTFVERIATLKGWYRQTTQADYVVFDWNERDPDIMVLLQGGVDRINAMRLTVPSGRPLRFIIESG